ncbi:hypothetical protein BJX99DRAFT_222582, partial [Aspergillus californicus]
MHTCPRHVVMIYNPIHRQHPQTGVQPRIHRVLNKALATSRLFLHIHIPSRLASAGFDFVLGIIPLRLVLLGFLYFLFFLFFHFFLLKRKIHRHHVLSQISFAGYWDVDDWGAVRLIQLGLGYPGHSSREGHFWRWVCLVWMFS